jgi:ATP/maltotriose-dependent transcriptional regulator MalT
MWGGMLCPLLRDARACLEHARALRRLGVKQPAFIGLADVNTGRALMLPGNWEEGVGYLRKAIAFHEAVGLSSQLMWAKLDEAEFFASQGQIADGLALIADESEHDAWRATAFEDAMAPRV